MRPPLCLSTNRVRAAPARPPGARLRIAALAAVALAATAVLYLVAPDEVGADFELFRDVSLRLLAGEPLYEVVHRADTSVVRFLYLPHVAFFFAPLALLPLALGWAILCSVQIAVVLLLGLKWKFDFLKLLLCATVPPALYTLFMGNIDGLVMGALLLPAQCRIAVILAKPQVAVGLAPRTLRYKETWIALFVVAALALFFGFQDAFLFARETGGLNVNLWRNVTPWQFVPGLALLWLGMRRNDERLLLMGSPFLTPYLTQGSLWPVWMGLCALSNRWAALALWALVWLAYGWGIVRLLTG